MRPKRFLSDADEVLFDFQNPTYDEIHRLFGRRHSGHDLEVWDMFTLLSKEERDVLFAEIRRPGYCRALKPIPGAQEGIKEARARKLDVFAVTSHFPEHPTWVMERDAALIADYGFKANQIVHTSAKYLVGGEYFLDDNPGHNMAWRNEHPDGLGLLWHIPNTRTLPFDDVRVHSWEEVLKRIEAHQTKKTVLELLDESEWTREGEPYAAGNYCRECAASETGSKIPTHKAGCRLDEILSRYRAAA
jgi:5'(3')-deoxyribonucleotidase